MYLSVTDLRRRHRYPRKFHDIIMGDGKDSCVKVPDVVSPLEPQLLHAKTLAHKVPRRNGFKAAVRELDLKHGRNLMFLAIQFSQIESLGAQGSHLNFEDRFSARG